MSELEFQACKDAERELASKNSPPFGHLYSFAPWLCLGLARCLFKSSNLLKSLLWQRQHSYALPFQACSDAM